MAEARVFTLRPLPKPHRSDLRDSFRIYLSASSLAYLKLSPGSLCTLRSEGGIEKTAVAWNAVGDIKTTVVQASSILQECYCIKLGEKLTISKLDGSLNETDRVQLEECTHPDKLVIYGPLSDATELAHWEWALEYPLSQCGILSVGLGFEAEIKGQCRSFKVVEISTSNPTDQTISLFTKRSRVQIGTGPKEDKGFATLKVVQDGLGGLTDQIIRLNHLLVDFNLRAHGADMPRFYRLNRGILIHGPKGTGKSSLLRRIESAGWHRTFSIRSNILSRNSGDGEAKLSKIFKDASRAEPSVIIIDQIDSLAPKRSSPEASSLAHALCESIDALEDAKVLVVAATRHPNDIDDSLRTPHRLSVEVEVSIPTAASRKEILCAIRDRSSEPSDSIIDFMAEKTHGYVGADLFALLQMTCRKARDRLIPNIESPSLDVPMVDEVSKEKNSAWLIVNEDDVIAAMQEVRPTAMREVFLETPKVRWMDIGGQHALKKHLQKMVERPLKFPERMRRLNVKSRKGILLYGPPGCSKTLVVKALATEAGLNFLAVKGAEILSMYVGESERKLREIFQKARSARPSILFFDEIDAIAAKRTSSSGGVNVLTTLLNEMDGIEELKNVLVVAATNKPGTLDPALMRPGRLDNIVYVGPPDYDSRREIFSIWTSKSVVSSDLSIDDLAARTEGYSGAEIISLCETAGEAALDEEDEKNEPQEVMWHHFEIAFTRVKTQLTPDIIAEYEQWAEKSAL
ncbi:AAA family ATPase, putative [Talaromyces stipitatus ATCC 10500]|uniref:AAA family ATPase, putative n=1 Tax=Talaromyces stipitatus (strain ATCC 10500 / CBS 375.48 / QM 6759 / NRRL 1006) TaxID=441959 RepID=B8MA58_TALSN|nr:AAA family ATPase, putative [Talaromyces stipitatus ATCC 10500]EED18387.1 AAA family ATPase, putative [Talaromyces stipitatus ATCC 10500]